MIRAILELVLMLVIARSFWRVIGGIMEGLGGRPRSNVPDHAPDRGVPMMRDPVCGTFVLPERAVTLIDGRQRVFFCSTACRDAYRARSRGERAEGRTA